jgi:4-amino-4-deoxy-L-arabinose transferase-like glycosyltransferase
MKGAWIAVAVGMALRVVSVSLAGGLVYWDAISYRALARSLAEGGGFGVAGHLTAFWVPGWPAWMSLFFRAGMGDASVALGSVLLGGATVGATFLLGRDLHGPLAGARAAAVVAMLPSLVLLPCLLLSENLALPLSVGAVGLVLRARRTGSLRTWAMAGAACALATLVREASLSIVGAAIVLALLRARTVGPRGLGVFTLVFALGVAPWILRNRAVVGVTALTTSASENLCVGLGAGADGGFRRLPWFFEKGEIEADAESDAKARECVREGLALHPLAIVTLAPAKLARLLAFDDWEVDEFFGRVLTRRSAMILAKTSDLGYWALLVAAAIGFGRHRQGRVLLVTVGAFVVSTLVTFGVARFHAVWLPLLAVLASNPRGAMLTEEPHPRSQAGPDAARPRSPAR